MVMARIPLRTMSFHTLLDFTLTFTMRGMLARV